MARRPLSSRFWRVWGASAVSSVGDGVQVAAFPLLAVTLTRDPRLVAGLTAAAAAPWLLFSLFAGVFVDRWDRRRTMLAVDLLRAAVVGSLAVLVATDRVTIWACYAMAFLLGTGETLFDNATLALTPALVERVDLARAGGYQSAAQEVGNYFVGPPVGGALFALTAATPFGINAVSFALSALLLWTITGRFRAERAPRLDTGRHPSIWAEIGEGIRFLRHDRLLRTLALMLGVWNFVSAGGEAMLVLLAQDELGLGARGFGVLLSAAAVGSILGSVSASRIAERFGVPPTLRAILVVSVAAQGLPGVLHQAWAVGIVFVFGAFGGLIWNVLTIAIRQERIPDPLLGRVTSAYRLVGLGTMPLGALAGGFIANAIGLRSVWLLGAGVLAVGATFTWPRLSLAGVSGDATVDATHPAEGDRGE